MVRVWGLVSDRRFTPPEYPEDLAQISDKRDPARLSTARSVTKTRGCLAQKDSGLQCFAGRGAACGVAL